MEWIPPLVTGGLTLSGVVATLFFTSKRDYKSWMRSEKLNAYEQLDAALSSPVSHKKRGDILTHAENVKKAGSRARLIGHPEIDIQISALLRAANYFYKEDTGLDRNEAYIGYNNALGIQWDNLLYVMLSDIENTGRFALKFSNLETWEQCDLQDLIVRPPEDS